jgi:hypothetical protein
VEKSILSSLSVFDKRAFESGAGFVVGEVKAAKCLLWGVQSSPSVFIHFEFQVNVATNGGRHVQLGQTNFPCV